MLCVIDPITAFGLREVLCLRQHPHDSIKDGLTWSRPVANTSYPDLYETYGGSTHSTANILEQRSSVTNLVEKPVCVESISEGSKFQIRKCDVTKMAGK